MWKTVAESQTSPIEGFVRQVINDYPAIVAERNAYERYLEMRENKEIRDAFVVDNLKVAMIEGWFNLLNYDERFVIEQHLLQELEWPRIAFNFMEQWKGVFSRAERTLVAYQASGLKKIISFVKSHQEMTVSLFADTWKNIQIAIQNGSFNNEPANL